MDFIAFTIYRLAIFTILPSYLLKDSHIVMRIIGVLFTVCWCPIATVIVFFPLLATVILAIFIMLINIGGDI